MYTPCFIFNILEKKILNGTLSGNETEQNKAAVWTYFDDWSDCSLECGGGSQNRTQKCVNPVDYSPADDQCEGAASVESRPCNEQECGGMFHCIEHEHIFFCTRYKEKVFREQYAHPQ